jgi:hypothetical protein
MTSLKMLRVGDPFVCGKRMTIYTHIISCGDSIVNTIKHDPSFILTKTFLNVMKIHISLKINNQMVHRED